MRIAFLIAAAIPVAAQEPLSLRDAVRAALQKHPSAEAAKSDTRAAEARAAQARAGRLPRAGYTETFQSSNNPVFAFGTLLTQRRFAEKNFAIGSLNDPGFVNNFQTQVGADWTIWDAGANRARESGAVLGVRMSAEQERASAMRRALETARAYQAAVLAAESAAASKAAVASAEADLRRAESVMAVGMSTAADVLSIRVHVAAMKEQAIRRHLDERVARAVLNEAMGAGLEESRLLTTTSRPAATPDADAPADRPELRQAGIHESMARAAVDEARSALYPRVALRGMFEADRGRFVTQGGANWWLGASLQWNAFDGGAARQRVAEARHRVSAATWRKREAEAAVKLEELRARASVDAAAERIAVAAASVTQAEESLRIVKNRYEAGLSPVSDLLRNESALLDARLRRLAALHDQRMAAVQLEFAKGTLTGDSNVLE